MSEIVEFGAGCPWVRRRYQERQEKHFVLHERSKSCIVSQHLVLISLPRIAVVYLAHAGILSLRKLPFEPIPVVTVLPLREPGERILRSAELRDGMFDTVSFLSPTIRIVDPVAFLERMKAGSGGAG